MSPAERGKKDRAGKRALRAKRLREGKCTKCGGDPSEGRLCPKCQEKGRKYVKKSYNKKRGGDE
jgi:hypothetical protein